VLQQTGHADSGLPCFNVFFRVSRHLSCGIRQAGCSVLPSKGVAMLTAVRERHSAAGEVLLSHNQVALLEGLASFPAGKAPSLKVWIGASYQFLKPYRSDHLSFWNLYKAIKNIPTQWVKKRPTKGSAIEAILTPRGRDIVSGQIPAYVRRYGPYKTTKASVT
jgi:hypothetical protein